MALAVDVRTTPRHLEAASLHVAWTHGRALFITGWIAAALALALIPFLIAFSQGRPIMVAFDARSSLGPAALAVLAFPLGVRATQKTWTRLLHRSRSARGLNESRVTMDDDGVKEDRRGSHHRYAWGAVTAIDSDEESLYLHLGRMDVIIIPRAAFFDEDAFQGFQDEAVRLWRCQGRKAVAVTA